MSVIAVRAGVARMVVDHDPAEGKEALGIIETTTRQALHEMRLLAEVLHRDYGHDAALSPAPGLADVTALVEQVRLAGILTMAFNLFSGAGVAETVGGDPGSRAVRSPRPPGGRATSTSVTRSSCTPRNLIAAHGPGCSFGQHSCPHSS